LLRERASAIEDAPGWFHLGAALHRLGRLTDAAASFQKAAALAEHPAEAHCALATVLAALGKHDEAEIELRRSIERAPSHAQSHHNLAVLLAQRGNRKSALEHYDQALESDPRHKGARANRASLRLAAGNATGALQDYNELCADAGANAESRAGRVRSLLLLHRDEQAYEAAGELVRLYPGDKLAWRLKATAAASLHLLDEAEAASARTGTPASGRTLFVGRALDRLDVCDWRDRDLLLESIRSALAEGAEPSLWSTSLLFHALALPLSGSELKAIAEHVATRVRLSVPRAADEAIPAGSRSGRIRVGFISPDIRIHPGAHLLWPLFRERDREKFEYFLYTLNADDGSAIRASLASSADSFVDASSWGSEELIRRMRRDQLDILVDKSGYFEGTRPEVVAARVAPLQVGYLGMACTMGTGLLDYRLTDALTTPPESQPDWSERLLLLPPPHWPYDVALNAGHALTREHWALPSKGFVFCCFNQAFKLSPDLFRLWLRVLQRVPDSVLWLLEPGEVARTNLCREAAAAGVTPERLIFAPWADLKTHLGRLRHADLFLDTLHYGAHTTAADVLHAGVPVLTYPGDTMAARLCATMVRCACLPDLVTDSLDAYESKALEIALAPDLASELKHRLQQARATAPFFDMHQRVRGVEKAFMAIVERQRAGLPPAMLPVD
jgi:protein O-GlcNAc transferase